MAFNQYRRRERFTPSRDNGLNYTTRKIQGNLCKTQNIIWMAILLANC